MSYICQTRRSPGQKKWNLALAKYCGIVYNVYVKTRHEDIEQRLKRAVLESDMSRYQIAKISGVSEAQLSFFVNGKRTLTLPVAAKLAEVLGLELRPKKK